MCECEGKWRHLERRPGSFYKQLFLKGTRIRAEIIYDETVGEGAMTPEEVAADRNLPLEVVQEAIAYCASNPPEIARDHAVEEALAEATGANDPDYKWGGKYRVPSPEEMARIRRL